MENDILKVEIFSSEADEKHRITSVKEIKFVLQSIAEKGSRVAFYFGSANDFYLTTVLAVDSDGLWLEQSKSADINQKVVASEHVIFVSTQHAVKIQFSADTPKPVLFNDQPALWLALPESLYRLQRREYFRLTTPATGALKCVIPPSYPPHRTSREVTIMDISGSGIALTCSEHDTDLVPGESYKDCVIDIPEFGAITGTILVRNLAVLTNAKGQSYKRAGCELQHMDNASVLLLQRYVMHLQRSK